MNRHVAWTLIGLAGAWATGSVSGQMANPGAIQKKAGGQAAPAPAAKAATDPAVVKAQREADLRAIQAMNPILAEWEKRSALVNTLDVVFDRVVKDAFGIEWSRGRAMLQSPDKACLQFTKYKLDKNNKPLVEVGANGKRNAVLEELPDTRTVCTGTEVLLYNWGSRSVNVYPLDKQNRQKALQEGPLPFLFNMKAEDAKKRYSMRLVKEDDHQYTIGIVPQEEIDRDAFAQAFLLLNKKTFLPDRLELYPVGGKKSEVYIFNGANDVVRANDPMDQKYFRFQAFKDWKTIMNEQPDAKAAGPGPIQPQPRQQQAAQPGPRTNPPR